MSTTNRKPNPGHHGTKTAAAALITSIALLGGTAAAANASDGVLPPGSSTDFGTNTFGESRICVYNYGRQTGEVVFSAFGSGPETDWIPPHRTYCKSAWWWGFDVNVANQGTTYLYAYRVS
jgi:hypothetical protein